MAMKAKKVSSLRLSFIHYVLCVCCFWVILLLMHWTSRSDWVANKSIDLRPSTAATVTDPFFTLTPKRARLCFSEESIATDDVKAIFIPSIPSNVNMSAQKIVTRNLRNSLRRFRFRNYILLENISGNSRMKLADYLKSLKLKEESLIVTCNTVEVLLGATPEMLTAKLSSIHARLVVASIPDEKIALSSTGNELFCAFGQYAYVLAFLNDWLSPTAIMKFMNISDLLNTRRYENTEYAKYTSVDNDFVFFGYIPAEQSLRQYMWSISGDIGTSTGARNRLITPATVQEHKNLHTTHNKLRQRMRPQKPVLSKVAQYSPMILLFQGLATPSSLSGVPSMPSLSPAASIYEVKTLYDTLGSISASQLPMRDPFNALPVTKPRNRNFRLVACLTSLPHRLPNIVKTIQSLVDQHVSVDAIYLNLPKSYVRFKENLLTIVPENLRRLPIIINMVERDFGPATKLIPTLMKETDPTTVIITVDDDMVFKPTLFGLLLRRHLNNPHLAYGNAGQLIDIDGKFGPAVVRTAWQWKDNDYPVDIIEAFRGAIYERSFFDNMAELTAISEECFFTDDIWISAYLARRHIPRVKVVEGWGDTAEFAENDKIEPLRNDNVNGTRRNDLCALSLLSDFKLGWSNSSNEQCSFEFHRLEN